MDLLISEVKKRPALWDRLHKFYRHRVYTDKSWDEISKVTGISSKQAKDKWKNLRDHFKREVHKLPEEIKNEPISLTNVYAGRWRYFPQMMFLLDFVRPLGATKMGEFESDDTFVEYDEVNDTDLEFDVRSIFQDEGNSCSSSTQAPNSSTNSTETFTNSIKETNTSIHGNNIDDADLCFLQSLLPYFKELPPLRKLQVRTQFENVLIEELAAVTAESSELQLTDTIIKLENPINFN